MSKKHRISKWALAYHSKYTPWKKRAVRGHERAAQKRSWQREHLKPQAPRTCRGSLTTGTGVEVEHGWGG